jgi:hypothetical protein
MSHTPAAIFMGKALQMDRIPVEIILPEGAGNKVMYKLLCDILIYDEHITKGFVTDGASIPRLLWPILPPVERYFLAAVLHDWKLKQKRGWRDANLSFARALVELQIEPWIREVMVNAVKVNAWRRVTFLNETY